MVAQPTFTIPVHFAPCLFGPTPYIDATNPKPDLTMTTQGYELIGILACLVLAWWRAAKENARLRRLHEQYSDLIVARLRAGRKAR
jgi:hypothetical protein